MYTLQTVSSYQADDMVDAVRVWRGLDSHRWEMLLNVTHVEWVRSVAGVWRLGFGWVVHRLKTLSPDFTGYIAQASANNFPLGPETEVFDGS
jgi:hypothetical protein